jgi:hypothetical protein
VLGTDVIEISQWSEACSSRPLQLLQVCIQGCVRRVVCVTVMVCGLVLLRGVGWAWFEKWECCLSGGPLCHVPLREGY